MAKLAAPQRHGNEVTAARMVRRTGDVRELLKRARRELRKARQARSRRRFAFWTAVAASVELDLRADLKIERTEYADVRKSAAGIEFVAGLASGEKEGTGR